MAIVRYLVSDVDASLAFYERLGFTLVERWGPPFAIVEKDGLQLWLSGPQTSAAKPMPDGRVPEPGGWNRIVVETDIAICEIIQSTGLIDLVVVIARSLRLRLWHEK